MFNSCFYCPYKIICDQNNLYPEECDETKNNDPDFSDLIYRKYRGEDYWNEMSYRRFVEDELDYGDLNDMDDDNDN